MKKNLTWVLIWLCGESYTKLAKEGSVFERIQFSYLKFEKSIVANNDPRNNGYLIV